jgi:hypothetical protein
MNSKRFKVGTFNLYNLILPNVVYYGDRSYSPELFAKKQEWIGRQLVCMDSAIVGFQEVFQLEALQQVINASGMYANAQVLMGERVGESPAVGLVSRFPVVNHRVINTFPAEAQLDIGGTAIALHNFSRPVLCAEIALTDELRCTVFVVHLKSKRPVIAEGRDRNDPLEVIKGQARALIQRAAEATALRQIIVETTQNNTHPVILMGDINDGGLAVTSQMISGEPPFRRMPFEKKQAAWDILLYHVKDIQARLSYSDFYYTHIHNGHYESLDHIMVSQEFVQENPNRIARVGAVFVLNDHLIDESLNQGGVQPWQSDHAQVVAAIELENR